MARIRAGGGGAGWAIATVLFVVLFFFAALMAIIFFTQNSDARLKQTDAETKLRKYVTAAEEASPEVAPLLTQVNEKQSVITLLRDEIRWLKNKIMAGQPSREAIDAQFDLLNIDRNATLLSRVQGLKADKDANDKLIAEMEENLKASNKSVQDAQGSKLELDQAYKQSVDKLRDELSSQQSAFELYRRQKDRQLAELDQQLKAVRDQSHAKALELQSVIAQKDEEIRILQKRLEDLAGRGRDPKGELEAVTTADGQIMTLSPDDKLVYINLSRKDRVSPGMTFEVFSKNTIIKLDNYDELRGKATIEVISISDSSSLARVIRLDRGVLIQEGDQIANIVYDRNSVFRFFVYGQFDIDNIGQATDTDRERIKTMISQWGGTVSEAMTFEIDYLVLGKMPELPEMASPGESDIEVLERIAARRREYEEYQNLIAEAKRLSIPILNQNRFLALVGYHRR